MDHVIPQPYMSVFKLIRSSVFARFRKRHPAPHLRITEFLPPETSDKFLCDLLKKRDQFRARGISASGNPAFFRLISSLQIPSEFLDRFNRLTRVLEQRFDVNLPDPEITLVAQAYNDGSHFGKHSDAHAGGPNWQRRLSGVYYLHTHPRKFGGGSLALYDYRGHVHFVDPEHNSAVFFPRDLVHEVLPVSCDSKAFEDSRFAINIWIS